MPAESEGLPVSSPKSAHVDVENKTLRWVKDFVVGLNLCPFARPLLASDVLRVAVCEATDDKGVAEALLAEIELIQKTSDAEIATTLVVFPNALQRFDAYLMFLEGAQQCIEEMDLWVYCSWRVFTQIINLPGSRLRLRATSLTGHRFP